jgi:hypothetical protein
MKKIKMLFVGIMAFVILGVNGIVAVAVVSVVVGSLVAAARFISKRLSDASESKPLATEEVSDAQKTEASVDVARHPRRAADRVGTLPVLSDATATPASDKAVA